MTGCEKLNFYPVLNAQTTNTEADAPSGLDLELHAQQFETFAFSPSQIKEATVVLPEGLTINPDAADGQTSCSDAQANFGSEAPANCPDNCEDRHGRARHPRSLRAAAGLALLRRTSARQPVPDLPRRRRLRHPRQAGRRAPPRPGHRADHGQVRRPAAGPLRKLQLPHLLLPAGAARDPDPLRHLHRRQHLRALEQHPRRPALDARPSASTGVRTAAPARVKRAPSRRPWSPAPRTRWPAPTATST